MFDRDRPVIEMQNRSRSRTFQVSQNRSRSCESLKSAGQARPYVNKPKLRTTICKRARRYGLNKHTVLFEEKRFLPQIDFRKMWLK